MQIFGHRGWPTQYTENTIEGMLAAIAEGVDGIELDVRLSGDNQCVVFHDDNTLRLTDRALIVSQTSWPVLSQLPLKTPKFEHQSYIPKLSDVLSALPSGIALNIELKTHPPHLIDTLISALSIALSGVKQHDIVLSSFDLCIIEKLYQELPHHRRAIAYDAGDIVDIPTLRSLSCHTVSLHYSLLSPHLIQSLNDEGISSTVWTVNTEAQQHYCKQLCVDSIITDHALSMPSPQ